MGGNISVGGTTARGARTGSGSFDIENWNRKMELRTLADFALHPKPPAVRFHQMFCNGKAEARATYFARPRNIHTVKAFEDAGLIGEGNTNSGIGNCDDHFRPGRFTAYGYLSARGR